MTKFKERIGSYPARPLAQPRGIGCSIPNVGVTISKANRHVVIRDRDQVYEDILMQGEDMDKFLQELKHATQNMPNASIKDALVIVTAPYVGNKWSWS